MRKYLPEHLWNHLEYMFKRANDELAPDCVIASNICCLMDIKNSMLSEERYEWLYDFKQLEDKHAFTVMTFENA
jgi:hypothetical protein